MTIDILYSNTSVTNIGATTFGIYNDYKLIVITSVVSSTVPASTVCLVKGTSAMSGPS